ncbi:FG-GAP-like repeat-containing protein [Streptomyces buecherae]|uniref:FG-GAP-like repeat-containing protein n=1 Tax=Streptomyces buecherae TaxID=2763006 RepID=UPI00379CEAF9
MAIVLAVLAATWCVAITRPTPALASPSQDRKELAEWWAPVHFQDVDTSGESGLGGKSDYITSYDFDGDINGRNNWENTSESRLPAHVYYSVVETKGFAYLLYTFFHPRDWADGSLDDYQEDLSEHENDTEGVLVIVERNSSRHGTLKAAITVSHSDFYSYVPEDSDWTSGAESVDGDLPLKSSPHGDGHSRPWTAQQANTHAVWSFGARDRLREQYEDGDGVLYVPGGTAEEPEGPNDRDVQYTLTDVFAKDGMWDKRNDTSLFATPNNFAGDFSDNPHGVRCGGFEYVCGINSASAPWAWDDETDLPGKGYLATNPAELVFNYFNWPGKPAQPDLDYTWNPYNGIAPPDPPEPTEWRVMGLGSSSTLGEGSSDGNGYRDTADGEFRKEVDRVDWVGSVRVGTMSDRDVEGWSGAKIDTIAGKAECAVKTYKPNLVTLLAGGNDVLQDYQMGGAIGRLEGLVRQVITDSPKATVLVAGMQQFRDAATNVRGKAFSAQISAMVERLAADGKHVAYADVSGLTAADIANDGIHPNDGGHEKLGNAFASAARKAKGNGWIASRPEAMADNAGSHPCGFEDHGRGKDPSGADDSNRLGAGWDDRGVIQNKQYPSSSRFWMVDINKDRKAEFVAVDDKQNIRFWWNSGPSGRAWTPFVEGENSYTPSPGAVGNMLRFGDVDGDGFPDCMVVELNGKVHLSTWKAEAPAGSRMCMNKYDGVASVFSKGSTGDRPSIDPTTQIRFADVTGGGRDDYLLTKADGTTTAWLNRGFQVKEDKKYLDWTEPLKIGNALQDPRQIRYADINGDKRADRVLITARGGARAWLNEGGTGASGKYRDIGRIAGDAEVPTKDVQLADINGDGKADFLRIGWTGVTHAWLNELTPDFFKSFHP